MFGVSLLPPGRLARALLGRWRWMALAVLVTCAVTVRLGFWQLDRLAGRRAYNAELAARLTDDPVVLSAPGVAMLPQDLADPQLRALEYRPTEVRGRLDFSQELALGNQIWDGKLGLHLLTPMVVEGTDRAVLVDRGWLPAADTNPSTWAQFRPAVGGEGGAPGAPGAGASITQVAEGTVLVKGWLRLPPAGAGGAVPGLPDRVVTSLGLGATQPLVRERLLPLIVEEAPDLTSDTVLPYRRPPVASVGEGVHAIAAAQWFVISGIVLVGLVLYVSQKETAGQRPAGLQRAPDLLPRTPGRPGRAAPMPSATAAAPGATPGEAAATRPGAQSGAAAPSPR